MTTEQLGTPQERVFTYLLFVCLIGLIHPLIDELINLANMAELRNDTNEVVDVGKFLVESYGLMFVSASISASIFINYLYNVKSENLSRRILHWLFLGILIFSIVFTYMSTKTSSINSVLINSQFSIFFLCILYASILKYKTIIVSEQAKLVSEDIKNDD